MALPTSEFTGILQSFVNISIEDAIQIMKERYCVPVSGYSQTVLKEPPCPDRPVLIMANKEKIKDLPLCEFPGELHRGVSIPCGPNTKKDYNFDKNVWYTWRKDIAQAYAGPDGCILTYTPRSPLRLLDFWHYKTIAIVLYVIANAPSRFSIPEVQSFQLYTGIGLSKQKFYDSTRTKQRSRIVDVTQEVKLLDPGSNLESPDFMYRLRPDIPNIIDPSRCLRWGNNTFDFDHSSTRTLDQHFGNMLGKIFKDIDGVAVRFNTPSTMHRKEADRIGDIHSELFLLPVGNTKITWKECNHCNATGCQPKQCGQPPQQPPTGFQYFPRTGGKKRKTLRRHRRYKPSRRRVF